MADEEGGQLDAFVPANKKLTIFVLDGSEKMFGGGNDCDFRKAVKVVYSQMLNVCCSGSLNHMIGVIVTNTKETNNRSNHKHSFEWIKLAVPGSEEALELKSFLDSDDIHSAFKEKFGGHEVCNLGHVIWGCRKVMQLSATATRHHMIMFFTNEPNPFGNDLGAYEKFKKLIGDFTCTSYRDRNGLTKIVKTPGEFHLALLCDVLHEKDRKRWEQITPMIFHGKPEDMEIQAYKKTFSQRAFSMVNVEIAPGVKFGVGVYLLAAETRPPTKQLLDAETETKVQRRTAYVPKNIDKDEFEEDDSAIETDKGNLKKSLKIGGQEIVSETEEITKLSYFDSKGIQLLGFKPIDSIDLTTHLQNSQLLYPDDTNIRGSVGLYTALLDRCHARKMAMICRFCVRTNQKVRLVALVPQKKLTEAEIHEKVSKLHGVEKEKKLDELRLANEYRHNGFLVVFLPYAEDLRDLTEQMQSPVGEEWPTPNKEKSTAAGEFVSQLTKPYTPESYCNPRLRSFNAMLIEAAVGDQISRDDSIAPYFKNANSEMIESLQKPLEEYFTLDGHETSGGHKRAAGGASETGKKKAKLDLDAMTTKEIVEQGMLEKLTVADLKAKMVELKLKPAAGAKKADLVDAIRSYFS